MEYSCGSNTTEKAVLLERELLDEEPMDDDDDDEPASAFCREVWFITLRP